MTTNEQAKQYASNRERLESTINQAQMIAKGLWEANQELAEEIAHEIYELRDELSEVLYNDWRLPTIDELITLIDYSTSQPASFNKSISSGIYLSSSTHERYNSLAWVVNFEDGYVSYGNKYYSSYVCFVRTGKDGLEWSADAPEPMDLYEAVDYAKNLTAPVAFKKMM